MYRLVWYLGVLENNKVNQLTFQNQCGLYFVFCKYLIALKCNNVYLLKWKKAYYCTSSDVYTSIDDHLVPNFMFPAIESRAHNSPAVHFFSLGCQNSIKWLVQLSHWPLKSLQSQQHNHAKLAYHPAPYLVCYSITFMITKWHLIIYKAD